MSEGSATTLSPGSIDQVVRYLEVWLGHRRNGMAWVEYESDLARDMAIERLEKREPSAARVRVEQAGTRADWETLRTQIEARTGLVHVTFSAVLGSPAIPQQELGDFALAMNLDREPIFAVQCQQIWWLRKELAAAMQRRAPDFVSWVHLRMALDERPVPSERAKTFGVKVGFGGTGSRALEILRALAPDEASSHSQRDVDKARATVYQARRLAARRSRKGRPRTGEALGGVRRPSERFGPTGRGATGGP